MSLCFRDVPSLRAPVKQAGKTESPEDHEGGFLATRRGNGVLSSCLVVQQPTLTHLATFSLLLTDQCPS